MPPSDGKNLLMRPGLPAPDQKLFRDFDRAALDLAYNNVTQVGQAKRDAYVSGWMQRSAIVRRSPSAQLDLRYGSSERQRLDAFSCGTAGAPTVVYIHGGYWQWNDKERDAFVAEGALLAGFNVMLIEYTLAPAAQMEQIVGDVRGGIAWVIDHAAELGGDPSRVFVAGHSAGGHLASMALQDRRLAGGIVISGIFDLEPILLGSLNDNLGLDFAAARRFSPIHHLPPSSGPLIVTVGVDELPELVRQSEEFASAWRKRELPGKYLPVPGRDHFSILEELARPGGVVLNALMEIARAK